MDSSLEETMRPGHSSQKGFLGSSEKLEEVLMADNLSVKEMGFTHEELAARIEHFIKAVGHPSYNGVMVDGNYWVSGCSYRGWQDCPWGDGCGQYGSYDFKIKNIPTQQVLSFPGLIVHLIREHHFYEGKESPYRVDPKNIVRVLDMQKKA